MFYKKHKQKKIKRLFTSDSKSNHRKAFELIQDNQLEIQDEWIEYFIDYSDLTIIYGKPFIDLIHAIYAFQGLQILIHQVNDKNLQSHHPKKLIAQAIEHNDALIDKCADHIRGHTEDEIKAMILREIKNIIEL
ncbi:hypothetical protein [Microscilla marina]|uniref:Uncharacterized protein n=1 Tax=Microscilla marina ATCC 23134 TaxID=313606 RepID=A1ZPT6_MICM2|nr:hypothetical protein [Microscilla marina]EAY27591.1 hypothetical protein M23134_02838 [Microscilla marina ATCC 23134]